MVRQLVDQDAVGAKLPYKAELGKCPGDFESRVYLDEVGGRVNEMLGYIVLDKEVYYDSRASADASSHGVRTGSSLFREIDAKALRVVFGPLLPGVTPPTARDSAEYLIL